MLRTVLIGSSYAPMLFMVAVRLEGGHPWAAIGMSVVAVMLVIALSRMVTQRSKLSPSPYLLVSVRDDTAQVPAYLITYLFPFVFLQDVSKNDLVVYCVFMALVVVLAARTQLVLVNPLLLLLGLHLYEIETKNGTKAILLSRSTPKVGAVILAAPFAAGGMRRFEDPEDV